MRETSNRVFDRYLGIDYSGAETPTSSLEGLRLYSATPAQSPAEVIIMGDNFSGDVQPPWFFDRWSRIYDLPPVQWATYWPIHDAVVGALAVRPPRGRRPPRAGEDGGGGNS